MCTRHIGGNIVSANNVRVVEHVCVCVCGCVVWSCYNHNIIPIYIHIFI